MSVSLYQFTIKKEISDKKKKKGILKSIYRERERGISYTTHESIFRVVDVNTSAIMS